MRRNASRYFASPGVGQVEFQRGKREEKEEEEGEGNKRERSGLTGYTNCQPDGIASSPRVSSPRGTVKKIRPLLSIGSPIFEFESNFLVLARSNEALKTRSNGERIVKGGGDYSATKDVEKVARQL